jgi:hypothetical protein
MAFMAAPAPAGIHEDSAPVLAFNAKAGRLFLLDRVQDTNGDWSPKKTDVTMQQPAFAVDFGRLETGWIHFSGGRAPIFIMAPHGQQCPPEPDSPGTSNTGRTLRFKAGFRLPVISQAIGGVREFAGNSGAMITGMNELHTLFEAAPEARAGQIPVVRMTDVLEVQSGQSSNFQPVFTIIAWADRPAILGPRTVAPPGAVNLPPRQTMPAYRSATEQWEAETPRDANDTWAARNARDITAARAPTNRTPDDGYAPGWRTAFEATRVSNGQATNWASSEIPF